MRTASGKAAEAVSSALANARSRGAGEAELGGAARRPRRIGLEHAHLGAAGPQGLGGEQADRPGARDDRVARESLDAAQHARERLDERAGEIADALRQPQHGVRDVRRRGGRQLAEAARLERARNERRAERLVAAHAVIAGAARDMMGECDAGAGGQRAVHHHAGDLVPEHGARDRPARPQLLDIAAAQAACAHAHEDAARGRSGGGKLAQCGRPSGRDRHGEHERTESSRPEGRNPRSAHAQDAVVPQRELGDLRRGGGGERRRLDAEDGVGRTGGGPDVLVGEQIHVAERREGGERSERCDTADREAGVLAHAARRRLA